MDILPVEADRLSFGDLRNFKRFYELIRADDIAAPTTVKRVYRAFRFLHFFGAALIQEGRHPALNRCWEDLRERFGDLPMFDDGIFIESWIFMDFPLDTTGRTVLDEFAAFCASAAPDVMVEIGPFIESAKRSRLGLHQETMSTGRLTKYKELFTGNVVSTLRSVPDYEPGEIFLGRIIQSGNDRFLLGDPKNWPATHREALLSTVSNRLLVVPGSSIAEQYEQFMKLSGPYWMSCVSGDFDDEILDPDHWRDYHASV
jgi:hypothetical protein